jgi:hypothetical protein
LDGIELMSESFLFTLSRATFEYDLTELEPPAQVHEVDQTTDPEVMESNVVH